MPRDYVEIPLTQGKVAIVDIEDARDVLCYNWCVTKKRCQYYAMTTVRMHDGGQRVMFLHNFILPPPPNLEVDHIDGDGLNNRRDNLRLATHSQNRQNSKLQSNNTSGYKGVDWYKRDGKWRAKIMVGGRRKTLGVFNTKEEAAAAYDAAAIKHFGEFARLNGDGKNEAQKGG